MQTGLDGESYSLQILQVIKLWLYWQMLYAQCKICVVERDSQNSVIFSDTNKSSSPSQKTKSCQLVDHKLKIKESKELDPYSDLGGDMKLALIPIIICIFTTPSPWASCDTRSVYKWSNIKLIIWYQTQLKLSEKMLKNLEKRLGKVELCGIIEIVQSTTLLK